MTLSPKQLTGIAAVLAIVLVVITLLRRPAAGTTVAGLLGLLTIASHSELQAEIVNLVPLAAD